MRIRNKDVSGVTMLSLLIGISLGTFLIVVMLQIFSATRANYQLSQNLDEMDSVVRYASIIMNDIIGQAGYRTPDAVNGVLPAYSSVFPTFTTTLVGPDASTYDTGETNADDPAGMVLSYFPGETVIVSAIDPVASDKLWVKFEGDPNGSIRECNDLYGIDDTAIQVRFYSRTVTVDGNDQTAYYCERQDDGATYTYAADAVTGTALIPAGLFDGAYIRYGEDITGNGYIDRWSLGADVQNRNQVYAVRVAFLLHTRDPVRSAAVTQTFSVFDQTVTFNDLYIHRLYMFTVMLPNAPGFKMLSTVATP